MNKAIDVFEMVKQFLSQNEEEGLFPLLRIACMGNAEKTIQGELFRYLRCNHNLNAVIECGCRDNNADRHIDVMVFDNDWSPIVAIELKHYSPHQGTINPLLGGLEKDYDKRPEGLPLIQVGLYTAIDSVSPFPLQPPTSPWLKYYRVLMTYVLRHCVRLNTGILNPDFSEDEQLASKWANDPQQMTRYSQNTKLVEGSFESFQVDSPSGPMVTGRVNWIAMLAAKGS